MTDYEALRRENLRHKQTLLAELNLNANAVGKTVKIDPDSKTATKKRKIKIETVPLRASSRIASTATKPTYNEDAGEKYNYIERKSTKKTKLADRQLPDRMEEVQNDIRSLVPSKDAEELRAGWAQWKPLGPAPSRDEDGTLHFSDHPTFTPNKSPDQVIREGCFGGSYWRPLKSRKLGILVEDDWKELPQAWHSGLDVTKYMTSPSYDADANKFKVVCGQSIEEWEAAGWISFEHDIRGWFQWYCRFYQGRRCADDERQVTRWRKCVGETGRWRRMLLKKYMALGVREVNDDGEDEEAPEVSPVMHQTCHHWAFELRQPVLDEFWRSGGR